MADSTTTQPRANLTLRIERVAPHDELLFKSLVRLLNHRTQHNWTFDTGLVDLRVIGKDTLEVGDDRVFGSVLWVGHSEQNRSPFLQLPIHANELEPLLNTLGANLLQKQADAHKAWPPRIREDEVFMLHRWPPASMLGTPMRIKLATLMTGRSISLETLALRSGAILQECEVFCQALDRAGLLQRHDVQPQAQPALNMNNHPVLKARPELSLLGRIRRRLGL